MSSSAPIDIDERGGRPLITYILCKARSALRYWDTLEGISDRRLRLRGSI